MRFSTQTEHTECLDVSARYPRGTHTLDLGQEGTLTKWQVLLRADVRYRKQANKKPKGLAHTLADTEASLPTASLSSPQFPDFGNLVVVHAV